MSDAEQRADDIGENMAQAFEEASERIEAAMARAATAGEDSFSRMTDHIVQDLARLAIEQAIMRPVERAAHSALSSLPFLGARAEGGPVAGGGAYLVGERGPELFQPDRAGEITPLAPPMNVTLNLPGQTTDRLSERRLARQLARMVARGRAGL
ncbi:MAG: phage tail tape measure protein [Alphaproteobacteria bacterium]|nr:phage tail tape measure protein [Alphaproteobacteria bacterium]